MSATDEPDDRTLLHEFCATRSESAFTALVSRHLPLVFHAALRRLGSAALAEEAAQSAFSRFAAKASSVARHPERLRAWLCRTAYLEACKLARRETRLSRLPMPPAPDPDPMNRPEIYDRLDDALNRLPELDRELVIRHCCDGEEYRDIAAVVGKSAAACQKRVERALVVLGRGLGGAKTAGVALAAFAASNAKSSALPSAERIAAVALQQQAAVGAAVGTISGLKIAACAALVLAGGAAGWERQATQQQPPEIVRSTAARSRAETPPAKSVAQIPMLAPRPDTIVRTRDEVLESIQAGRLGPLVEFLPSATVADLQAIIAEDDIGWLGEGSGDFGTAHDLAVLRWAELEPASCFRYGLSRGGPIASIVLAKWLTFDPKVATEVYLALPGAARRELVPANDDLAQLLAEADPVIAGGLLRARAATPLKNLTPEQANGIVAASLTNTAQIGTTGMSSDAVFAAYKLLAGMDPEGTLARAELIPLPDLRASVLTALYHLYPPAAAAMAPGKMRTLVAAREAERQMVTDREAVIRKLRAAAPNAEREAIYKIVVAGLGGSEPLRALEITTTLRGGLDIPWSDDNLQRILKSAGRSDPKRALAMVPELAVRLVNWDLSKLVDPIICGWMKADPAGAIQWLAKTGIEPSIGDYRQGAGDPEPLLNLLTHADDEVRGKAQMALLPHLEDALENGTARALLNQMPATAADEMLGRIANDCCGREQFDDAVKAAALASPAAREREILPDILTFAVRFHPDQAADWFKSMPAADQSTAISGLEYQVAHPKYPGQDAMIRKSIEHLKP